MHVTGMVSPQTVRVLTLATPKQIKHRKSHWNTGTPNCSASCWGVQIYKNLRWSESPLSAGLAAYPGPEKQHLQESCVQVLHASISRRYVFICLCIHMYSSMYSSISSAFTSSSYSSIESYWILLIHAGPMGPPPSPPPKRSGRAMAALQASDLKWLRQQIPYSDIESYDIIWIWSWYVRIFYQFDSVWLCMHLCIHLLILMQLVPSAGTVHPKIHPIPSEPPVPFPDVPWRLAVELRGILKKLNHLKSKPKTRRCKNGDFMIEV